MIVSLTVENIALIDRLDLEFSEGLNILSGETGAGKSVLLDSMNLILGERAERSLIRHGQDSARVEALFYPDRDSIGGKLAELGIPFEDDMVVVRELTAGGRSVCRINGRSVTLGTLRTIMNEMVDLHGQHEHQSLLDAARHIELLDSFAGDEVASKNTKIAEEWRRLKKLRSDLAALGGDPAQRHETADLLRFQIDEVSNAGVTPGELDELETEQKRIEHSVEMRQAMYRSYAALYESENATDALSSLQEAVDSLEEFEQLDGRLSQLLKTYREAYYLVEDGAGALRSVLDDLEPDEERAHFVVERIDVLHHLFRKYHVLDEEALLASLSEWKVRLAELESADEKIRELAMQINACEKKLERLYRGLSALRQRASDEFSQAILEQLDQLGMSSASFEVRYSGLEPGAAVRFGPKSPESAEFYISVNRGEPLRPLAKIASGGEISRIMLAFKVITADHDGVGTLIFDEIDTGISGRTAQVVGEKMARIGRSHQVIAVTHLPQIAVMGDRNFYIHKETQDDRTVTHIDRLDVDGVRSEMVRLTGGLESQNAEALADEMMAHAAGIRTQLREQHT